ncbi:MAG TPA: rhomboid family intramembrane serine protease [Vicinamibacterales bacterium]|nr:rhomboid family intramembrane serine protease [Vicinamibacterales bacterium]
MTFLIFLAALSLVAYRAIPKETTARLPRVALALGSVVRNYGRAETAPFFEALAARIRRPIAAVVLVLACLLAYRFGSIESMGSVGPRTTNGEWWRLLTAIVLQQNAITLVITIAALVQLGYVVERLVGRFAFTTAFAASGVLAGLWTLSAHPLQATAGASSAIAGLYGLLLVSFAAGLLHRSEVTIPIAAMKQMAPVAVAFALASLIDHASNLTADVVGFAAGIAVGAVAAHDVSEGPAPTRLAAMAAGGALLVAVASAIPLRGILDVRPELQRVVALERSTADTFDAASARLRAGAMTPKALASVIDTAIVPALRAEDDHLAALTHVAPDDKPMLADAHHYLQLRVDSWTLRAQSLREPLGPPEPVHTGDDDATAFRVRAQARHRATSVARGKAEAAEHAALEAFARLAPAS